MNKYFSYRLYWSWFCWKSCKNVFKIKSQRSSLIYLWWLWPVYVVSDWQLWNDRTGRATKKVQCQVSSDRKWLDWPCGIQFDVYNFNWSQWTHPWVRDILPWCLDNVLDVCTKGYQFEKRTHIECSNGSFSRGVKNVLFFHMQLS